MHLQVNWSRGPVRHLIILKDPDLSLLQILSRLDLERVLVKGWLEVTHVTMEVDSAGSLVLQFHKNLLHRHLLHTLLCKINL